MIEAWVHFWPLPSSKPVTWQHQHHIDVSTKLPKGFGYILYADYSLGGSPEEETLETAQSGSSYATSAEITSAIKSWP